MDKNKHTRGRFCVCARVLERVHNWSTREAVGRRVANKRAKTFSNIATTAFFFLSFGPLSRVFAREKERAEEFGNWGDTFLFLHVLNELQN